MNSLSEVTCVLAQRAAELERAREIFVGEIRRFTEAVLANLKQRRADAWISPRVRLDCPKDILFESKTTGYFRTEFAQGPVVARFKKGANYQAVADLTFGIEFVDTAENGAFVWTIKLVPFLRYQQLDDAIWHEWKLARGQDLPPGSRHVERANVVLFVVRPLSVSLTTELATDDVRQVLDFVLRADRAFASACGVDPVGEEHA